MEQILAINLPIFLMIAVGYISIRSKSLSKEIIPYISQFIIKISLPCFLIYALSTTPLQQIWQAPYFLSYTLSSISIFLLSFLFFRKIKKMVIEQSSIFAFGGSMANTGFIGTAVLTMVMGTKAVPYLAMTLIIESIIMLSLMLTVAEVGINKQNSIARIISNTLVQLAKHPIIQAIIVGITLSIVSIQWPQPIATTLNFFSQTATPLALFVIGASLSQLNISKIGSNIFVLCGIKMLIMPLTMLCIFSIMPGVTDEMKYAALILAALPMASATAIYAQSYGVAEEASAAVMISAILSFASLSLVLFAFSNQ